MRLPIFAYGHPVLRKKTREIAKAEVGLEKLIDDMFSTMYGASGVGLAAPQVGMSVRLFIADGSPMEGIREGDTTILKGWKKVFINPEIVEETGDEWAFEEGCLSIPDLRSDVWRKETVIIRYLDRDFKTCEETYSGMQARIIQHEVDHLDGVLFTDYVTGVRKQLIKSRLLKISKGKVEAPYPMSFYKKL